jgi:hypothetical protein
VRIDIAGSFDVALQANVTVGSLEVTEKIPGYQAGLKCIGYNLAATSIIVNDNTGLSIMNSTVAASKGLTVSSGGGVTLGGNATIDGALDISGGWGASGQGNFVTGGIIDRPGSQARVTGLSNGTDLTISGGLDLGGSLYLDQIFPLPEVLTLRSGDLTVEEGGVIYGSGEIIGDVVNAGRIAPAVGNSLANPLKISGNLLMSSTAELTAEIGEMVVGPKQVPDGVPGPWVQVGGSATLGGTLDMLEYDSALTKNSIETVMTYASASGSFASVQGLLLHPVIGPNSLTVPAAPGSNPGGLLPNVAVTGIGGIPLPRYSIYPVPLPVTGPKGNVTIWLMNDGDSPALGTATVNLYAVAQVQGGSTTLIASRQGVRIKLKSNHSVAVHLSFVYPRALSGGVYKLAAEVFPSASIPNTDTPEENAGLTDAVMIR